MPGSYWWLDTDVAFYSKECAWAFAARLMQRIDGPDVVDVHRMNRDGALTNQLASMLSA